MVQILRFIEKFLQNSILESFLSHTLPSTRFMVSLSLSICLFSSDYIALGVITAITLLLIVCSMETIRQNWMIVSFPLLIGVVMAIFAKLAPDRVSYLGVEPGLLIWRFLLFCLAAAIWLILLPQNDVVVLVRETRVPQLWVATIAAYRGIEVGGWVLETVNRTRRTKRLHFARHPVVWVDGMLTASISHFVEFLNGFLITLRTRGVESTYDPRDGRKSIGGYDLFAYVVSLLGILGVFAWL